jgi:excisionase family DNA binding protein
MLNVQDGVRDAAVSASRYLKTDEAARYLGVSARTLTNWRWRGGGYGPAFVRAGRSVRYDLRTLDAWMAHHTFDSTSSADHGNPIPTAA